MTPAIDRPRNDFQLIAHQLIRDVSTGDSGDRRRLLDNVSLVIEPGQVVALVGGSGAGKSTLMRTLLGIEPTSAGQVELNGYCLRENFDTYRHQIGYVPQDDIIHGDLTVEEALGYAAKLRLPPDQNHRKTIHVTLHQIGMLEHKGTLVRDLRTRPRLGQKADAIAAATGRPRPDDRPRHPRHGQHSPVRSRGLHGPRRTALLLRATRRCSNLL
jgi:ABC-type uncharacterized transport system ATPase subunit